MIGAQHQYRLSNQRYPLLVPEKLRGKEVNCAASQRAQGNVEAIPAHQAYDRGGEAWRGVRTPRFTFARKGNGADWLLFDNDADPWQLDNRIGRPEFAPLQRELGRHIDAFIAEHDRLLPGDDFIRHFDLREAWNRSQRHFNLPQRADPPFLSKATPDGSRSEAGLIP